MASLNVHQTEHTTNKSLSQTEAAWKQTDSVYKLMCESGRLHVTLWEVGLPGEPATRRSFPFRSSRLPEGQSQMLRAAKVFTKVTCVFASASLRLLSLWPLLLSRALWRCLSSCRFFFSSRCCSRLCLLVTWKRRPCELPALRTQVPPGQGDTRGGQIQEVMGLLLSKNRENPPNTPEVMPFPSQL